MTERDILERLLDDLDGLLEGDIARDEKNPLLEMLEDAVDEARADMERLRLGVYRRAS